MLSTHWKRPGCTRILWTIQFVFLFAGAKRFNVFNPSASPSSVCSILEADFQINLTALKDGQVLDTVVLNTDMTGIKVRGDCEYFMKLIWPNGVTWQVDEYTPFYSFLVAFTPKTVFGHLTQSTTFEIYDSPRKAYIQSRASSYKCSEDYSQQYRGSSSGEINYLVVVDVKTIQVQLAQVEHDRFSPASDPECNDGSDVNLDPYALPLWFSILYIVLPVVPVILVAACIISVLLIRRRRQSQSMEKQRLS